MPFIEGFEKYPAVTGTYGLPTKWNVFGTGFSLPTGRFGGQCLQLPAKGNTSQGGIWRSFPASTSVSLLFAMQLPTLPAQSAPYGFVSFAGTDRIQLMFNVLSTGQIAVYRSAANNPISNSGNEASAVLLGTSASPVITPNGWHFIELYHTHSSTTGTVLVKVDGVTVLNLTGLNTANQARTTIDAVFFGMSPSTNTSWPIWNLDDIYFVEGTTAAIGEGKVDTLRVTADITTGLTRNGGATNFSRVNEVSIDGDTTFVSGSNVGDTDVYELANLPGNPTTVFAVQTSAIARKTDAASRSINIQLTHSGTANNGADYPLIATYATFDRCDLTNPVTATGWTVSDVNNLRVGVRVAV